MMFAIYKCQKCHISSAAHERNVVMRLYMTISLYIDK